MPKWSDVPWGTVITGVVAVYGAVLSTVTLVGQRRRDRLAEGEAQRRFRQDQLATEEARRHQAEQVTDWLVKDDGPEAPGKLFYGLLLQNGSSQLVHQLIVSVVGTQGSFRRTAVGDPRLFECRLFVGSLPPGQTKMRIEQPGQGMMRRYGIELAFQDAGGCYWLRQGNGILKQIDQHPVDLYGIPRPVPWHNP
jgi:hypothetical protein